MKMETSMDEESSLPDDPDYWDNIVEELLDIDKPEPKRTPKIRVHNSTDSETIITPDEPSTDSDLTVDDENFTSQMNVPYIYEEEHSDLSDYHDPVEETANLESQLSFSEALDTIKYKDYSEEFQSEADFVCELIRNQDMAAIDDFIANHEEDIGAICLVSGADGTTPLTAAAALGNLHMLRRLSEAGVWLFCSDSEGYMAIHRAAINGNNDIVQWLADQGQWTAISRDGYSALHFAAKHGHFQVVNTLLDAGQNVDEETPEGLTPLLLAVQNGHRAIVELLVGNGADINHTCNDGLGAIHIVTQAGQVDMVDLLILYGTGIDTQLPLSLKTPLHIAAENSHDQVVCKLLEVGANVDLKNAEGETVLHNIYKTKLTEDTIAQLCQKSSNVDLPNKKGRSALFLAVESGNVEATVALVGNGANPNFEINTGCTPLYAATHHCHWVVLEKLLLAGADVNKQTDNGSTALYKAARSGEYNAVALLLCSGAKVNLCRKTGWTPLHVAIHQGNLTVVEQLLAAGADVNSADTQGQTPLAIAAYKKNPNIVKMLWKRNEDPVYIYNVAKLGNQEVMKYLKHCRVNMEASNQMIGWRAIHFAAQNGHSKAIRALASVKVDINAQDSDGNTPLHLAILHKQNDAVRTLLMGHCYTSVTNSKGERSISLAISIGSLDIVQLLIRHGAIIDFPCDGSGSNRPLSQAIKQGHKKIASLLIASGSVQNIDDGRGTKHSPLMLVCKYGDGELFRMMLHKGVNVGIRDDDHNTLLHVACHHGHLDIVLELITLLPSSVNYTNNSGKKALHLAAAAGHPLIVESLLAAGTKVTIMEHDETVMYEMAKHKEVWEVIKEWAASNQSMLKPAPRSNIRHMDHSQGAVGGDGFFV